MRTRNIIIAAAILVLGYVALRALTGGGEGEEPGPERAAGETQGVEPGWDEPDAGPSGEPATPPSAGARPLIGRDPEVAEGVAPAAGTAPGSESRPVPAVAPPEEPPKPPPAKGEIRALEEQVEGKVSPQGDDLKLRLAAAYRETGRDDDADTIYREVYRGRGPLAATAAAALLERVGGEARLEFAAFVVERGPNSPGYARAARIHGELLATKSDEASQISAWRLLSDAYFSRPEESHRRELRPLLEEISERWLLSPRPCTLARTYSVVAGDSLARIAAQHKVTVEQIRALNGRSDDLIHPGDRLKILDRPVTVVVDKSEFRLDVLYDGGFLLSFPVGHGAHGRTPVADFVVSLRQEKPAWYPANRPPVPYGEPGNPLGERWLGFENQEGLKGFGIHGTSQPETIGTEASEGCVRLRNEDVIRLYPFVGVGTRVSIVE